MATRDSPVSYLHLPFPEACPAHGWFWEAALSQYDCIFQKITQYQLIHREMAGKGVSL